MSSSADNQEAIKQYRKNVNDALQFPGTNQPADVWNGLFLMGLAVCQLELIPYSAAITPRDYWVTAPSPAGDLDDWPLSWIVELGCFDQLEPE